MPNISIYLPDDLYNFVKKKNPSKTVQEALREYIEKRKEAEGKHK